MGAMTRRCDFRLYSRYSRVPRWVQPARVAARAMRMRAHLALVCVLLLRVHADDSLRSSTTYAAAARGVAARARPVPASRMLVRGDLQESGLELTALHPAQLRALKLQEAFRAQMQVWET